MRLVHGPSGSLHLQLDISYVNAPSFVARGCPRPIFQTLLWSTYLPHQRTVS